MSEDTNIWRGPARMSLTMNALDPTSLERKIAKRMDGHAHPSAYQAKKENQTTEFASLPTFHINVDYFFCLSVKNAWVRNGFAQKDAYPIFNLLGRYVFPISVCPLLVLEA